VPAPTSGACSWCSRPWTPAARTGSCAGSAGRSTRFPWYIVPADRKWYRDWAVAALLREIMDEQHFEYPPPAFDVAAERPRLAAGS
jgi:hypothetical protein